MPAHLGSDEVALYQKAAFWPCAHDLAIGILVRMRSQLLKSRIPHLAVTPLIPWMTPPTVALINSGFVLVFYSCRRLFLLAFPMARPMSRPTATIHVEPRGSLDYWDEESFRGHA
jgi:hypothetical protein